LRDGNNYTEENLKILKRFLITLICMSDLLLHIMKLVKATCKRIPVPDRPETPWLYYCTLWSQYE